MKKLFLFSILTLFLLSCNNLESANTKLDDASRKLEEAQKELDNALKELDQNLDFSKGRIVHTVYLKLKEDLTETDIQFMVESVKQLAEINGVINLKTGTFLDLGDQRAMSDYQLALQMEFETESDYRSYQSDPIHEGFKKELDGYLAGPPLTHDFVAM